MINLGSGPQDIQSIRQYITNRGIQYPNRYRVEFIPRPRLKAKTGLQKCDMYPLSMNLPEQSVSNIGDYYYTTPRSIPTHVETGMILMNFILMKDWQERDFFEKWMHAISYGAVNQQPGYDPVGSMPYDEASDCTLSIGLLNGNSPAGYNAIYDYSECFPAQMTPVEFDSTIGGYATFQVGIVARSVKIWRRSSSSNVGVDD